MKYGIKRYNALLILHFFLFVSVVTAEPHRIAGGGPTITANIAGFEIVGHDLDRMGDSISLGRTELRLPRSLGIDFLLLKGARVKPAAFGAGYTLVKNGRWSGRVPITLGDFTFPVFLLGADLDASGLSLDIAFRLPAQLGSMEARVNGVRVHPSGSFEPKRSSVPVKLKIGELSAMCESTRLEPQAIVLETVALDTGLTVVEGSIAIEEYEISCRGETTYLGAVNSAIVEYGNWKLGIERLRIEERGLRFDCILYEPYSENNPIKARFSDSYLIKRGELDIKPNEDDYPYIYVPPFFLFLEKAKLTKTALEIESCYTENFWHGDGELTLGGIIIDGEYKVKESTMNKLPRPVAIPVENGVTILVDEAQLNAEDFLVHGTITLSDSFGKDITFYAGENNPAILTGNNALRAEAPDSLEIMCEVEGNPAILRGVSVEYDGLNADEMVLTIGANPSLRILYTKVALYSDATFRVKPEMEDASFSGAVLGSEMQVNNVRVSESGISFAGYWNDMQFEDLRFSDDGSFQSMSANEREVIHLGALTADMRMLRFDSNYGISIQECSFYLETDLSVAEFRGSDLFMSAENGLSIEGDRFDPINIDGSLFYPSRFRATETGVVMSGSLVMSESFPDGLANIAIPNVTFMHQYEDGESRFEVPVFESGIIVTNVEGESKMLTSIELAVRDGALVHFPVYAEE